ncbi:MAG: hypothetical protein U9R58_13765 [Chloroflexota bacterium]|nr:hypothetical protein [Chloroflexota bacterium]
MTKTNPSTGSKTIYDTWFLSWLNLIVATVFFGIGYGCQEIWYMLTIVCAIILLWIVAGVRNWFWVTTIAFILHTIIAAAGFFLSVESFWLILGLMFALFAWDLTSLTQRLSCARRVESQNKFFALHIRRLVVTGGLGVILAVLALNFNLQFSFGWLVLLGLLSVLGISYTIRYILRTSQ